MDGRIVGALAILSLGACSEHPCSGSGLVRVSPETVTIAVGQSTTVQYQEGDSCLPTAEQFHAVASHWSTRDTTVVGVDSLSGRVVGRAVGDASVAAATLVGPLPVLVHVR